MYASTFDSMSAIKSELAKKVRSLNLKCDRENVWPLSLYSSRCPVLSTYSIFELLALRWHTFAHQAEKRYSPYENQMQRAQAANRAQMFLNKINGEREERCLQSFKKSESDGQLLPVKDHRKSQSRRKSSRSSSHVCHITCR